MPTMIELPLVDGTSTAWVNPARVQAVYRLGDGAKVAFSNEKADFIHTILKPEQVAAKLNSAM